MTTHNDSLHEEEAYCPVCDRSFAPGTASCPADGAKLIVLAASADPLIGKNLNDRYEVRSRLGQGAMGVVYAGWQHAVDREVAIKVIDSRLVHDRAAVKRFMREARLASRLSQPSVVAVHDFGQTEDQRLYLVMELVRGRDLAEIARRGPMPVERVLRIAVQVCDALEAAHRLDIVHRDLKPANILLLDEPPGRDLIKVLDFGLAKSLMGDSLDVTLTNEHVLGTPLYMAPETIRGLPVDARADLYALGVMLHELLAGEPPFVADNLNLLCSMHLEAEVPALPASVPAHLQELVRSLLAKEPSMRPVDAGAVRRVLQHKAPSTSTELELAKTVPSLSATVLAEMASPSRPRRGPKLLALTGMLAAAAAAGAYVATRGSDSTPSTPASAVPDALDTAPTLGTNAGELEAAAPSARATSESDASSLGDEGHAAGADAGASAAVVGDGEVGDGEVVEATPEASGKSSRRQRARRSRRERPSERSDPPPKNDKPARPSLDFVRPE